MKKVVAGVGIGTAIVAIVGYYLYSIFGGDSSTRESDVFDKDGYDKNGFNRQGYDRDGYNIDGYDCNGVDRQGYDQDGFDKDGFDRNGFNVEGYTAEGFDKNGYDIRGFDKDGYDREGYNRFGRNHEGFTKDGYGLDGFNKYGYDRAGFGRDKYNYYGIDRAGHDRNYYNEYIRSLRIRLKEALSQFNNGKIRYAIFDARVVMEDSIKALIYHIEGPRDSDLTLCDGINICKNKGLLGNDELINKLHAVRYICNPDFHTIDAEKNFTKNQVYFIIMQVFDLIGIVEEKLAI